MAHIASYFWYWAGAGILATLVLPVLMIFEGRALEAAFVALPAMFVLGAIIAITAGFARKA